jgi:hypothetical protein
MKHRLLARGYQEKLIDSALVKARNIPRKAALKRSQKKEQPKGPIFAVKFDPRLPSVSSITAKHWRSMTSQDQYLAEVFPQPPLTAFRRQTTIRNLVIKAKVPDQLRRNEKRQLKGMAKCGKSCTACPYIKEGKTVKINQNKYWSINKHVNCESYNIVYLIECDKNNCQEKYIGESGRNLKKRLEDHRGYIVNKKVNQATGAHFNLPGHSVSDLKVTILEQVKRPDTEYRKQRENYHIRNFNTFHNEMNRQM